MNQDVLHRDLAEGKWHQLSLAEQLANVGSEVSRCIKWKGRKEPISSRAAERALELMWLTKSDPKHRGSRLRKLCRLNEVMVNDLMGYSDFKPDLPRLEAYFSAFAVLANRERQAKRDTLVA